MLHIHAPGNSAGVRLAGALLLLALSILPASAAMREVRDAWVKAYDNLEAAETAEAGGDLTQALNLYREARRQFLAVHRQDPQWNPSLVNYRINYSLRKIKSLEKALRLAQSSQDRGKLVNTLERQADQIAELTRRSEDLEYKLQITAEALEKARTEAARHLMASHRVPQLLKEKTELERERDRLQERVGTLERAQKNEGAGLLVRRLQQEKKALEVKLGEAKADSAEIRRVAAQRAGRLEAARDRLRLAAKENQALKQEVAERRRRGSELREEEEKQAGELRQQLAKSAETLAETQAKLAASRKRTDELTQALEAAKEVAPEKGVGTPGLKARIAELEAALAKAGKTDGQSNPLAVTLLRDSLEETKTQLAAEKTEKRELEQRLADLRSNWSKRDQKLRQQQQALVQLRQKLQAAAKEENVAASETQIAQLRNALTEERQRARKLEAALHQALAQQEDVEVAVTGTTATEAASEAPSQQPEDDDKESESAKERQKRARDRDAQSYLREGLRAEETGNTEAAVWNYRKVIEIKPDNVVALHRLGLLAAEKGDDERASDYLRRAAQHATQELDILIPLGFSLARQEKPYEAVGTLAQAIAVNPDDARPHRALGVAASSLGWIDIAEREMREALRIDPEDSDSAFNLAILLASKEPPEMDEARKWYVKARELSGQSDPALDHLFGLEPIGVD